MYVGIFMSLIFVCLQCKHVCRYQNNFCEYVYSFHSGFWDHTQVFRSVWLAFLSVDTKA